MERRQIKLAQRVFRKLYAVVIASAFRGTVADKMFRARRDAVWRIQPSALVAAHVGARHRRAEIGIFSGALGHSSPSGISRDIHHRRKSPADSARRGLVRRHARGPLHQLRIPTGSETQRDRKFRAKSVNHIETEKERYVQAGLLHHDALEGIHLACGRDIEERPDLSLADHAVVIGASRARSRWLSGGILN